MTLNIPKVNRIIRILNILAGISLLVAIFATFYYAPVERTMGNVQRIFYFHVGTAWVGCIAFFVALVCGILYLRKPERRWDAIAVASVEIGLVFLTVTTIAGSVWGKPAWNTWWLWSPRLTLITIAWLTYAAYFMLRGAIEDEEKRGRFAAIYVIVSFVTIIMAYISVRVLRDIHPVVFGDVMESAEGASEGLQEFEGGLESMRMGITLTISVTAFSIIYTAWLVNRVRLQYYLDEVKSLKLRTAQYLQGGRS